MILMNKLNSIKHHHEVAQELTEIFLSNLKSKIYIAFHIYQVLLLLSLNGMKDLSNKLASTYPSRDKFILY